MSIEKTLQRLDAIDALIKKIKAAPLLAKAPLVERASAELVGAVRGLVEEVRKIAERAGFYYCACGAEYRADSLPAGGLHCPSCGRPLLIV